MNFDLANANFCSPSLSESSTSVLCFLQQKTLEYFKNIILISSPQVFHLIYYCPYLLLEVAALLPFESQEELNYMQKKKKKKKKKQNFSVYLSSYFDIAFVSVLTVTIKSQKKSHFVMFIFISTLMMLHRAFSGWLCSLSFGQN